MAKKQQQKWFVADFETSYTDESKTAVHVWDWGMKQMSDGLNKNRKWFGNNLDSWYNEINKHRSSVIYFHNAKFDCNFLKHYLLKKGFKVIYDQLNINENQLFIKENPQAFYWMKFCYYVNGKNKFTVEIIDSFKLIPMALDEIPEKFGLSLQKSPLDFHKLRPIGYCADPEERARVDNDIEILGEAIKIIRDVGVSGRTISASSLKLFKKYIGHENFNYWFPNDYEDDDLMRKSYQGGLTKTFNNCEGLTYIDVLILDINSSYPDKLAYYHLPIGYPKKYEGQYQDDIYHPLYIQNIDVIFELKDNHAPTVIKKNSFMNGQMNEYWKTTDGEFVNLTLTSVDLKLFFKHHNVIKIKYNHGWKFKSSNTIFKKFIERLYNDRKLAPTKGINTALKLIMNNLYGIFGFNPIVNSKNLQNYMENDNLVYTINNYEIKKPVYLPVAAFVTSYGRQQLCEKIQQYYPNVLYCDTDSVHLKNSSSLVLEPNNTDLGGWKHEKTYVRAKYLRAKTYIGEFDNGDLDIKCSGLPKQIKHKVTFDNFKIGLKLEGKLRPVQLPGGIALVETTFEIKEKFHKL